MTSHIREPEGHGARSVGHLLWVVASYAEREGMGSPWLVVAIREAGINRPFGEK